jgi:glycosyltransferase involved in cell wall biosynthesis
MSNIDSFFTRYGPDVEIVFVDDASSDQTPALIKEYCSEAKWDVQTLYHDENKGRGATVSDGIRAASNSIVGFLDIDLEVPIHEIHPLVQHVQEGADIACGYRHYEVQFSDLHRSILSRGYNWLIQKALESPFKDTEAGCKFFDRERILPLLEYVESDHWFWDTEIMLRADAIGLDIAEEPVLFIRNEQAESTVNLRNDIPLYLSRILQYRHHNWKETTQNVYEKPVDESV